MGISDSLSQNNNRLVMIPINVLLFIVSFWGARELSLVTANTHLFLMRESHSFIHYKYAAFSLY